MKKRMLALALALVMVFCLASIAHAAWYDNYNGRNYSGGAANYFNTGTTSLPGAALQALYDCCGTTRDRDTQTTVTPHKSQAFSSSVALSAQRTVANDDVSVNLGMYSSAVNYSTASMRLSVVNDPFYAVGKFVYMP